MSPLRHLTSRDTFFEDFKVGDVYKHARAKTVTEMDNVLITNLVMNTAQSHFNEEAARQEKFGRRVTFGGITIALVVGLVSEDTSENCVRDLGFDSIRLPAAVFHGDTIEVLTEIVSKEANQESPYGSVAFRHVAVNQKDEIVFDGIRNVLVYKREVSA